MELLGEHINKAPDELLSPTVCQRTSRPWTLLAQRLLLHLLPALKQHSMLPHARTKVPHKQSRARLEIKSPHLAVPLLARALERAGVHTPHSPPARSRATSPGCKRSAQWVEVELLVPL